MHRGGFAWVLILSLCLCASATASGGLLSYSADGTLQLEGIGPDSLVTLFTQWNAAYYYVSDFVSVSYTDINESSTVAHDNLGVILALNATGSEYLFGVVDDTTQVANALSSGLVGFPLTPYGVALAFRLDAVGNVSVIVDMNVMGQIYLGNIRYWNDSAIAKLNPSLTLPYQVIRPIVYTSSASATSTFTAALSRVIDGWSDKVSPAVSTDVTFPISSSTNTLHTSTDQFITTLESVDGTIGYVLGSSLGSTTSTLLINRNGTIVQYSTDSVFRAVDSFDKQVVNSSLVSVFIVNSPDLAAWPFCSISYLLVSRPNLSNRCEELLQLISYLFWAETNNGAIDIASGSTIPPFSVAIRNYVQDLLATSDCGGKPIQSKSVIIGEGQSYLQPVFNSWVRVYILTEGASTTFIDYQTTSREEATADILSASMKFAVTGEIYNRSDYEMRPDLLEFPLYAYGLAIGVNVPELSNETTLIFSAPVIAGIFNGSIEYWDDANILRLNPSLKDILPHVPMQVIVRTDDSDNTYVFTDTLSKMIDGYPITPSYGVNFSIPADRQILSTSDAIYSVLTASNYSITYIAYTSVTDLTGINVALVVNSNGKAVGPYPDNVLSAINDFGVSTYNPLDTRDGTGKSLVHSITNGPGAQSYPFSGYAYMVILKDGNSDNCEALTRLFDFVVWTQSYTEANEIVALTGAVELPSRIETLVLETLATVKCNGVYALTLSGCLTDGTICSDHGSCVDGSCFCKLGYTGTFCENTPSETSTSTIYIAVFTTVIPICFIVCCVLLIVAGIVLCLKPKDRPWAVDFSEIELKQQIGAGGYGAVHKAIWKDSDVAVKLLASTGITRELKKNFISEVKVMTQLRHPNVVLFMGACTTPPNLCIIMEFMELGSLYDVLHNELVPSLPMGLKVKLATQAAQGMHFLHSSGILHRDLKSPNILLDDKWNAKISDFGLTKFKQESGSDIDKLAGSLFWTAPEVLGEECPYSEAGDVYSFGIILWELLTALEPYGGMNPTTVAVSVLRDDLRPMIPACALPEYAELTRNCWTRDAANRPGFLEVVTRLKSLASSTTSSTEESSGGRPSSKSTLDASFTPLASSHGERMSLSSSSSDISNGNAKRFAAVDKAVRAPIGEVAIAFTDIYKAGSLWEFGPELMKEATIVHNQIIRDALARFSGYEVHTQRDGEGSFCVVFQEATDAIAWAVAVQHQLMEAQWDEKLLTHPAAAEELGGPEDQVIFKGLRVRMGIHVGAPRSVRDPATRRIDYIGAPVNIAAKITGIAHGGQILVSSTVRKRHKNKASSPLQDENLSFLTAGKMTIPGDSVRVKLYELKAPSLAGRFFGEISRRLENMSNSVIGATNRLKGDGRNPLMFRSQSLHSGSEGETTESAGEGAEMKELQAQLPEPFMISANLCRWVIDYDDMSMGKQIGMGSYGVVYKAKWKGVEVAAKRFVKQKMSERHMLEFRAEVAFLSEMHHPNIVLFIGACVKRPNLCIVTEYVIQGSLKDVLSNKGIKLAWATRMKIAKGAALGVFYLHSLNPVILHRDLKSSNILIDENWNAKVADFGFARVRQDNATMTRCGSPCWTAPEIIQGKKYSEKADVYSFGIILWEILTRQVPYKGHNYMNVSLDVVNGVRPKLPGNTPKDFAQLITRCWSGEHKKRPSMEKVVRYFEHESYHTTAEESTSSLDNDSNNTAPVDV
eukprot:TRINITY_DN138_c0_g2_i1.p1 TRINITY_DN138_c0_g2~~TRINITY_DN138_c0_g2_i1.p1  ORF type:complete len:1696 (-),score=223.93 TRINITY_DN138_c0_g2_i1:132-5219(-)